MGADDETLPFASTTKQEPSPAVVLAADGMRLPNVSCKRPVQPDDGVEAIRSHSYGSSSSHHSLHVITAATPDPEVLLKAQAERAVSLRLLPPLLLLVIISYLDRTALSFASIQLSQDLQLSSSIYGLGSGAFFLAYAVGQIPSNFLLLRFGGPMWLAVICLAWGAAASCMALVRGPVSFVLLRMLLGLAESGAFPGTWYYISCWYAADRTTMPYTVIETGITVSQVVAAPIAAGLLLLDGKLGLQGWQWLFMLEGVPAVLLGCFIGFWLPTSIRSAKFLSDAQKAVLLKASAKHAAVLPAQSPLGPCLSPLSDATCVGAPWEGTPQDEGQEAEAVQSLLHSGLRQHAKAPLGPTTGNPVNTPLSSKSPPCAAGAASSASCGPCQHSPRWSEMATKVAAVAGNKVVQYAGTWRILHDIPGNGVLYWTPKFVQALLLASAAGAVQPAAGQGSPGVAVVLLSAIPYAAASLAHLLNAWHSQKVGEAKLHIAFCWLLGAVALLVLPFAASGALSGSVHSSTAAAVTAFVLITLASVGINGANGLQTGLVAGCLSADQKALGLAMYNTIACLGSFLGPFLIGVLHDATGGYQVSMWVLGISLIGAALMVYRFKGNQVQVG